MSDAHKKDETPEDDFELDDFDDGDVDDFSDDEPWDDSDDDLIAEGDAVADSEESAEERPVKKKNKVFTLALIGGASVVALVILASTLGGAPKTSSPGMTAGDQASSALPGFGDGTDLPPQPTPIQADSADAPAERASGDVLTPMPPAGDDMEAELADLGFDLGGGAQPEGKSAGQENEAGLDEAAGTNKPLAEVEIDELTATPPLSEAESARLAQVDMEETLSELSAPSPSSPASIPAAPPQIAAGADPAEIKRLDGEIERLDEKLAAVSADLSQKMAVTDAKLDDVAQTLETLGNKLDKVAVRPEPVPAPVSKPSAVAAPAAAPIQKAQPLPASDTASTASVTDGPLWVLRSAQPGKAVLSEKGSNDLKTVEVGDSLKGIGKIVAIQKVDGRWVVQGMQGIISQ
ncbi:MAG: hypothetical protein KDJ75_07620 [Alphaproteobacteria bacterium]|nr:hypothetical protein [Alphaproteobacteria bacterium]